MRVEQLPADEGGGQREEGLMQGVVAVVAHQQAAVAVQPGEGAFNDPPIAPQFLAGLDAASGNARDDVPLAEQGPVLSGVVTLVGVQLAWSSPRSAWPVVGLAQGRDGIHQACQQGALIHVGGGGEDHQGCPTALGHQMMLAAGLAPIGRVRAGLSAPPLAGTREASTLARLQSILPASAKRCSRVWCSRSQTPACCQSRSRRHRVIPQQPISRGKYSQGIPVFSTKMIPASATRLGTGGCPRVPGGRVGGSSGSTTVHNSLLTSGLAMPGALQSLGQYC